MTKRYIVIPGRVDSMNDKDTHYISAERLIELYGFDRRECVIVRNRDDALGHNLSGLIILEPRYDGRYSRPLNPRDVAILGGDPSL